MEKRLECPNCGEGIKCPVCNGFCEDDLSVKNALRFGVRYCTNCGNEIASTLSEALAQMGN